MTYRHTIRTPDQRLRVFVSSTLGELAPEREAVRRAIERLRLAPVMFELGARPHPPRQLYRAYLDQSHVFVGIYWERYGWVAPGEEISGLEDEYRLAGERPRLLYIKEPSPGREARLTALLREFQDDDRASYKRFESPDELAELVSNDLALMLSERFELPPGESEEARSSAPPVPLTETIGRSDDLDALVAALGGPARLVTLTGPGGVGKTRLAQEAGRAVTGTFEDGIHLVPLAAVTEPALALRTIAERLGVRIEGNQSTLEGLASYLRPLRPLLILDNLEQVVDVGPALAELLEQCAGLRILATSRQPLRVRGEQTVPVEPLPLPEANRPFEEIVASPAVQLFVDRARAASPRFALTPENAGAVADLCRRLDGLPLAIELAAARTRLLPPAALLDRLGKRDDLLATAERDRPDRQRTLRATIDWSYELLDEAERALFARLSVFAGGCTLEAAEAVCGLRDDPGGLDALASLVDKSLLVPADEPSGTEPRFRMLETVRAYAAERLAERGEALEYRRRHLDWFRALAEEAQPSLCGPGQREWASRLDPERANLRAAAATALEATEDQVVVDYAWDLYVFYEIRDAVEEPEGWLARVRAAGRPLDEVFTAKLDTIEGWPLIARGQLKGVGPRLERALEVFRRHGMGFEAGVALLELAHLRYVLEDDVEGAVEALQESSRLYESVRHDWGVSIAETMLGSVHALAGHLDDAEAHLRRSLEHSTRIDNEPLIGRAQQQLALIRVLRGEPDEALPLVATAAALFRRGRYQTDSTFCLDMLAAVALARGDAPTAAVALTVAAGVRRGLGAPVWSTLQAFETRLLEQARASLGHEFDRLTRAHQGDVFETLDRTLEALSVA